MNRISYFRFFGLPLLVVVVCLLIYSCSTTQTAIDSKDLSYLYNPTKSSVKPRYTVLNESDESSVLSIKFFASELFFSEANPRGVPTAQMLISVRLYRIDNGRSLTD